MRPTTALWCVVGVVFVVSSGCATTRVETAWTDPEITPSDLAFQHVVAIAALSAEATQRLVEDALASAANTTKVTPAYALITREDRADVERLRAALERRGVDGAIVVRLMGIEEKQVFVPVTPAPYGGYYDHWHRVGARVYEPGYYRTDTEVIVETRLYNVGAGRLLWAGISKTINPQDVSEIIEGIVAAAGRDLRERKLVP